MSAQEQGNKEFKIHTAACEDIAHSAEGMQHMLPIHIFAIFFPWDGRLVLSPED